MKPTPRVRATTDTRVNAILCLVLASIVVTGCGKSHNKKGGDPGPPADTLAAQIGWVTPDPMAPILDDSLFSENAFGQLILRTALHIAFTDDATLEEVEALYARLNAMVVGSMPGVAAAAVEFPDPGSLDALEDLIDEIEAEDFVWFVEKSISPASLALPSNHELTGASLERIRHHLAVGGHAAWNTLALAVNTPRVFVTDFFGDGRPSTQTFNLDRNGLEYATGEWNEHGYHVLGIIAALHGDPGTPLISDNARLAAGMAARKINLTAVDLERYRNQTSAQYLQFLTLSNMGGMTVLNRSLGSACTGVRGNCIELESQLLHAALWTMQVRERGLEQKTLIVNAAGNISLELPGIDDALTGSPATMAALSSDMVDSAGNGIPPLTNTLVVENVRATTTQPYEALCLSDRSFVGGTIGAIGTDVTSTKDASTEGGKLSGTSMATPQVAGLAAYLLSIDPTLTPQQLVALLTRRALPVPTGGDPPCNDHPSPAPIIDAYGSVLGLDTGVTVATAPIRHTLLDVNADGQFDESDLDVFSGKFDFTALDPDPEAQDYERHDLNGDGYTGGHTVRRFFDLDNTNGGPFGTPSYTEVSQDVGGVDMLFNEDSLSDLDILCYYAYSGLYTGSEEARANKLSLLNCADPLLEVELPEGVGEQGAELYVRLGLFDYQGVTYGAEGAEAFITVTGGTALEEFGIMDVNGEFRTTVYLDPGADDLEVLVELVSPDDGYLIADRTRTAIRNGVGDIVYVSNQTGYRDIFTVMADGTGEVNLTNNEYWDAYPHFSADRSKIAFASNRGGNFDIYVMDADGSNVIQVTTDPGSDTQPTWSPDGSQLAFVSNRNFNLDNNLDIYIIPATGGTERQLTTNRGGDQAPDWSPDGTKIAFSSNRGVVDEDGNTRYYNQIYYMNASGGGVTRVSREFKTENDPAWSPSGSHFVFQGYPGISATNGQIYLASSGGSGKTALTINTNSEYSASWSADGTQILFGRYSAGHFSDIFIMDADGGNEVPVLTGTTNYESPHWVGPGM